MDELRTELIVLTDSQEKKLRILKRLLELTKLQEKLLCGEEFSEEEFSDTVRRKDILLKDLAGYDEGFETLYNKIKPEIADKKDMYKPEIQKLQKLIAEITETGLAIEKLEATNRLKMTNVVNGQRGEIRRVKISNKTAAAYYKNMSGLKPGESYFMDKKN